MREMLTETLTETGYSSEQQTCSARHASCNRLPRGVEPNIEQSCILAAQRGCNASEINSQLAIYTR